MVLAITRKIIELMYKYQKVISNFMIDEIRIL